MRIAVAGSTGMVGTLLVDAAEAAGHTVVPLTRKDGIDLTHPVGLDEALAGADAVVDVTNQLDYATAAEFFEAVGTNLGDAATRAGVARTVVLSIIGLERVPEHPYYVAKLAHERSHRDHSPGLGILRAAQFHDFPSQAIGWGRDGSTTTVDDMLSQPVAVPEVARVLLELATGERSGDLVEIAGPRTEQIADLARKVVARRGEDLTVIAREAFEPIKEGALLPGPGAVIAGPTFDEWLAAQPA
jgi:dTDP-4-dehydrorhamnose reductase